VCSKLLRPASLQNAKAKQYSEHVSTRGPQIFTTSTRDVDFTFIWTNAYSNRGGARSYRSRSRSHSRSYSLLTLTPTLTIHVHDHNHAYDRAHAHAHAQVNSYAGSPQCVSKTASATPARRSHPLLGALSCRPKNRFSPSI
jgi:ABC-type nickel/cobalt efflux system permease component RcnA